MNPVNKFKIQIQIILYIINFQIIAINCQGNVMIAIGKAFHTASLVGKKIFFLGGLINLNPKEIDSNHFFYLDISKSLVSRSPDKNKTFPFKDLTNLTLTSGIPPHNRATTPVGGPFNESIFLFGGNMGIDYHVYNNTEE